MLRRGFPWSLAALRRRRPCSGVHLALIRWFRRLRCQLQPSLAWPLRGRPSSTPRTAVCWILLPSGDSVCDFGGATLRTSLRPVWSPGSLQCTSGGLGHTL
eukprot:5310612-Pyramimonas_sp.AAC.1